MSHAARVRSVTSHDDRRPVLSDRLATHDLGVPAAVLCAAIRDEALRLFEVERAIVWRYRPDLQRLFADHAGEDLRAVDISTAEAHDILREPGSWLPQAVGVRRRLVEASFGMARDAAAAVVAVPLTAAAPVGLMLLQTSDWDAVGEVLAEIEAFASQAAALLANADELQQARDHELQLRALYETSGEISSNLELETVLRAIVGRACALTDAPIAYIQLADPAAGEIFMRVATGVSTLAFAQIRLRLGAGLGGTVAARREPFYTNDYLNDARFSHEPDVDDAVRGEGIKSILGVPMTAFDAFVGVLYVADRAARTFTVGEIDVLSSLADHAALAIENARLYERATSAVGELERANAAVQRHNRRLERAEELHRRLSEIVLAGDGLAAVIELMSTLVAEPAVVLDEHLRLVAAAGAPSDLFGRRLAAAGLEPRLHDDEIRRALGELDRLAPHVVEPREPRRRRRRLVVPIVAGAQLLGSVWIEAEPDAIEEERVMIEQAVRVVALELLKERTILEGERTQRRELLEELLAARRADDGQLVRLALQLGVDLETGHRLAVVALRHADGPAALRARERLAASVRGQPWCDFVGESGGLVVALVAAEDHRPQPELAHEVEALRGTGIAARAVLSGPSHEIDAYRANFVAADRVLQLLPPALAGPALVDLAAARVLALLFREGGEEQLRDFAADVLRPVVSLRPATRDELLRTLAAYLDHGGSPSRSAVALHVHVNTVYYRLERLRELLGDDFGAPHRALDFHVALRAQGLLEKTS